MTHIAQALPQKHDRVRFWWRVRQDGELRWVHYVGTVQDKFQTFGGSWMIDVVTDDGFMFLLRDSEARLWRFSGN